MIPRNHDKTTSTVGLAGLEEEGMLIFKDKNVIKILQEDKYDFALVDLPHSMLLSHKLSLPFAIFGLEAPHLIRRIPYMPRFVLSRNSLKIDNNNFGKKSQCNSLFTLYH